jgi:hypothetical protein
MPRAQELRLTVGILGNRLTRGPADRGQVFAGEFSNAQPGSWLVTKLFLGEGEAEVFLALNAKEGSALLIKKDPEYGEAVVAECARLF